MKLLEQISHDITDAMKARDAARLSALRMAKAALMNGEVAKGRPLEEPEAQQVLASLIKQRRDSIDQFKSGGRQDLVDKETADLAVLERYAPPAASAAEIEQAVAAAITETGASACFGLRTSDTPRIRRSDVKLRPACSSKFRTLRCQ